MRKSYFFILPTLFFALVFFLGFQLKEMNYTLDQEQTLLSADHVIGRSLPSMSVKQLSDVNLINSQILINKFHSPLLINIWASWCSSCEQEHHYLLKLAKAGINIIGVNYKDDIQNARQWLEEKGDPYQAIIIDDKGDFALELGAYGTPETYLIDKDGVIQYRHVGPLNEQTGELLLSYYDQSSKSKLE